MATHSVSRPEPLLTRAGIVSGASGLISLLVTLGVLPAALGSQLTTATEVTVGAVFTVIAVVGPLVHAFVSRSAVTPVSSPVDADGNELVPAGSARAVLDAENALAEADAIHPADDETPVTAS